MRTKIFSIIGLFLLGVSVWVEGGRSFLNEEKSKEDGLRSLLKDSRRANCFSSKETVSMGKFRPGDLCWSDGDMTGMYQDDGNLVIYKNAKPVWSASTVGSIELRVEESGNIVLYGKSDLILWTSNTAGNPGATLGFFPRYGFVILADCKDSQDVSCQDAPPVNRIRHYKILWETGGIN